VRFGGTLGIVNRGRGKFVISGRERIFVPNKVKSFSESPGVRPETGARAKQLGDRRKPEFTGVRLDQDWLRIAVSLRRSENHWKTVSKFR